MTEDEFYAEVAKTCRNCTECGQQVPCPGCCAGGVCDEMCACHEFDEPDGGDDDDS